MVKRVYTGELNGRKPRGRLRIQSRDNILADLQTVAITKWKEKGSDRDEWKWVVSATKNLKGSEC